MPLLPITLIFGLFVRPAHAQDEPAGPDAPGEDPASEEPTDEEPSDEEPSDEEPADEGPADEEPADDQPTDEELAPELLPPELIRYPDVPYPEGVDAGAVAVQLLLLVAEDGTVEDFAFGSSPTRAIAPPCIAAPANTAWRNASAARSTPGALPYQMPTTPSWVASGRAEASWLPMTAVAAYSSFMPGEKMSGSSGSVLAARVTASP